MSEVTARSKFAASGQEELAESLPAARAARSIRNGSSGQSLVRGVPEFTFLPLATASQKELTHPLGHPSSPLLWLILRFLLRGLLRDASPSEVSGFNNL